MEVQGNVNVNQAGLMMVPMNYVNNVTQLGIYSNYLNFIVPTRLVITKVVINIMQRIAV